MTTKNEDFIIEIYNILEIFIDSFGPVIVYLLREFKQHIPIWFLNIISEKIDFSNVLSTVFITYCKNITDITSINSTFFLCDTSYRLLIFNLYTGFLNENTLVIQYSKNMEPYFMKIIERIKG